MDGRLAEEIKKWIQGDATDDKNAMEYAKRDASIFEMQPKAVAYPKNAEDVKNLVKFVNDENAKGGKYSLTARAAGTDMSGGPLSESIVVDFTRYMNHVKEVGHGYAVTEPGIYYRDFEPVTLKKGLFFPSYPASRDLCTVGGIVANNSGGEKTLSYGQTNKYVQAIKMVLYDGTEHEFKPISNSELESKKGEGGVVGEIYAKMHELLKNNYDIIQRARPSVSKNSSGYDLWDAYNRETGVLDLTKVLVGSQGTLGLMTEMTLDLKKPKEHSRLVVVYLKDIARLPELTKHVLEWKPESFESFDDNTFKIALKLLPGLIKKMKGGIISLGFSFIPDFFAILTGGLPKLVLFAEFTGDTEEEAQKKADEAAKSIAEFKVRVLVMHSAEEGSKYWVIRRESFNMLRKHVRGKRTAPFIDDIIVHPDELPEFIPKLNALLKPYEKEITYTIAGHVGDANLHIIPLVDITKPHTRKIIVELAHKVYDLVFSYKGSMSGEHNDGLIRGPYLPQMYGQDVYNLFVETKKIFDPNSIFNPGKKTQATFPEAERHMVTS